VKVSFSHMVLLFLLSDSQHLDRVFPLILEMGQTLRTQIV
jgi:hypothetical protein